MNVYSLYAALHFVFIYHTREIITIQTVLKNILLFVIHVLLQKGLNKSYKGCYLHLGVISLCTVSCHNEKNLRNCEQAVNPNSSINRNKMSMYLSMRMTMSIISIGKIFENGS